MNPASFRFLPQAALVLAMAGGFGVVRVKAAVEADGVLANFGALEWIGGLDGQDQTNMNQSEWRPEYEGKPATQIELSEPHSATGDLSGNVYVADKNAHAIRLIGRDGLIRTVAGTNVAGFNGDGPATQRQLNGPQNAYPMPDGSFYILDTGNQRIRRVDAAGQMTTVVTESAGLSRGLWVKRDGSLIYYCTNTALKRWTPSFGNGPGAVMASGFSELGNLDVAANGDVYVTDRGNLTTDPTFSRVYRVPPTATPANYTRVVVAGSGGTNDSGPGASGSPAVLIGLRGVRGIAFHPAGGYFLATHKGGDLWYVDTTGVIALVIQGDDGNVDARSALPVALPSTGTSYLSELRFVSVAPNGDLLIAANDSGFILRARYRGPLPAPATVRIVPPAVRGGSVRLEWTPRADQWYRLESSSSPSAENWTSRLIAPALSGGALQTWTEPFPCSVQTRQHYRLREFRAWPN